MSIELEVMCDFDFYDSDGFDWPVSTVRPRNVARLELSRQLERFDGKALSDQDQGFLRLMEQVLQGNPEKPSRLHAGLGEGLIS